MKRVPVKNAPVAKAAVDTVAVAVAVVVVATAVAAVETEAIVVAGVTAAIAVIATVAAIATKPNLFRYAKARRRSAGALFVSHPSRDPREPAIKVRCPRSRR